MPRKLRSAQLETRTARLKLAQARKPYWIAVAPGIALGYRRNAGPGAWNVRAADGKGGNWIKGFAIADDQEEKDGATVLDFWQAADKAKQLARGQDADAGRPSTVSEALDDYATDLAVRGAHANNARQPRKHLTASLLSKPVSMLTVKELRHWRNKLLTDGVKASTINRMCKALKAALNLAASHDDRITTAKAWTIGLAAIPEDDDTESNLILSDDQRRDIVNASYAIGDEFGLYVEVHAATGARSGQIALLNVEDLHGGKEPRLMMPFELEGQEPQDANPKADPDRAKPGEAVEGHRSRTRCQRAAAAVGGPALGEFGGSPSAVRRSRAGRTLAGRRDDLLPAAHRDHARIAGWRSGSPGGVIIRYVGRDDRENLFEAHRPPRDDQMRRATFDADAPAGGNVVPMR